MSLINIISIMLINPTNMEIVLQQVSYHCKLTEILNLRMVSKFMKDLVSECIYTHIMVEFNDIVNNYQLFKCFQSLECRYKITNNELKYLGNCHTLNLQNCNITDNKLQYLGKCHTIRLSGCNKITDEGIKHLGNCHTLNLRWCNLITDEGIKHLGNCHTLYLHYCNLITDEGINMLKRSGVTVYH